MKKAVIFFLFSLLLAGCGEGRAVSQKEYGDKWPFSGITEGRVVEDGLAWYFVADGKKYALNGVAKSRFQYPYPYEAGIVKKVPLDASNPGLGSSWADTSVLLKPAGE